MRLPVALICLLLASTTLAAPVLYGHLPKEEVDAISATVRAATAEPIGSITRVITKEPIPGSMPFRTLLVSKSGKQRITMYERTDLVSVHTGNGDRGIGAAYTVQKTAGRWKIVHKGHWIR